MIAFLCDLQTCAAKGSMAFAADKWQQRQLRIKREHHSMSKLLFKLRHVPDDEAEEVRELMEQNGIPVYETHPGNWGISMPALWVQDDSHFEEAKQLLEAYQQQRTQRMRAEYEEMRRQGQTDSLIRGLRREPLRVLLYLGLVAAIAYLSISSFFHF